MLSQVRATENDIRALEADGLLSRQKEIIHSTMRKRDAAAKRAEGFREKQVRLAGGHTGSATKQRYAIGLRSEPLSPPQMLPPATERRFDLNPGCSGQYDVTRTRNPDHQPPCYRGNPCVCFLQPLSLVNPTHVL